MNAILYKSYGPAEDPGQVLRMSNYQEVPEIGDADVLVEVYCFSVTRFDVKMLVEHPLGTGAPSVTTPMTPCMDGSGVVVEVGSEVTRFRLGDCVFFSITDQPGRAAAEWVRVPETMTALKPRNISFKDAACIGSAAAAAMEGIDWMGFASDTPQEILILGGASDVGSCAIRYCKYRKWKVHATAAGFEACEWCVRLGADRVINTDEADGRWVHLFEPHTVNGVFETRGAPNNFADAETVLVRSGGCFVSIAPKEGHTVADAASFLPAYLWRKIVSPFSYYTFTEYDCATPDKMDKISKLMSGGVFCPITYGSYGFDLKSVQKAFAQVTYDVVPGRPVVVIQDRVVNERTLTGSAVLELEMDSKTALKASSGSPRGGGELEARVRAKASAEAAWAAFKRWCDQVNAAVSALSTPASTLEELKSRQERLASIKDDVKTNGKHLYETIERAVAQALQVGIKAGVSQSVFKEEAAKVSENVRLADKWIAKTMANFTEQSSISKVEPNRAQKSSVEDQSALIAGADSAWGSFYKWCDKVKAVIDSLSSMPQGLEDLQARQVKIKSLKSDVLAEGKVLYDKAETAILAAEQANVRLPAGVTLSALKDAASGVSSSVQTADRAIAKMIRKLQEQEQASAVNQEAQRAAEALQKFRDWCKEKKAAVEAVGGSFTGVAELRERVSRVQSMRAELSSVGRSLFDEARKQLPLVRDVTDAGLKAEVEEIVKIMKQAEKALSVLLTREEEREATEAANAKKKEQAREVLAEFRAWCMLRLQDVEKLSAPPNGLEDLRARTQKIAELKKDIKGNGKGLYEACLPLLPYSDCTEVELQNEIHGVANRIKTADKAVKTLLRKEEEKEAQLRASETKREQEERERREREEQERRNQEERARRELERQQEEEKRDRELREQRQKKASDALEEMREWIRQQQASVEKLLASPQGLADLQRRSDAISAIKIDIDGNGKQLYEKCVSLVGFMKGVSEGDLQKEFQELASRVQKAEKAIMRLLTVEEEKRAAEETAQQKAAREREEQAAAAARKAEEEREAKEREQAALEKRKKAEAAKADLLDWLDAKSDEMTAVQSQKPLTLDDVESQRNQLNVVRKVVVDKEKEIRAAGLPLEMEDEVLGNAKDIQGAIAKREQDLDKIAEGFLREKKRDEEQSKKAATRAAAEAVEGKVRDTLKTFMDWTKDLTARLDDYASSAKDVSDLRSRLEKVAAMKTEVQKTGKPMFDQVLNAMAELPKGAPLPITQAELEKTIKGVAERVTKANKALNAALKKLEEAQSTNKADDAVKSFKEWVAQRKNKVDSLTNPMPTVLKELQVLERTLDELRGEMRVEGRRLFDECCAMKPEAKDELKVIVAGCVGHMKKWEQQVSELVVQGLEKAKQNPQPEPEPEPEPKASSEASSESDSDSGATSNSESDSSSGPEDKRKAMLEKLKQKKSERSGVVADGGSAGANTEGGADDKKEALNRLRDKMNSMKEMKAESAGAADAESDGTEGKDRKATLLARLQSRKKMDDEPSAQDAEAISEGDVADSSTVVQDRKATLLAKLQSRKKLGGEGEGEESGEGSGGATESSSADENVDKKAALMARLKEAKSKKQLVEDAPSSQDEGEATVSSAAESSEEPADRRPSDADSKKEALLRLKEKMASRKDLKDAADAPVADAPSDGESSGGTSPRKNAPVDRKALLEKLKSRKDVKDAGAEEESGGGDDASNSRAAALERLKQKKLEREGSTVAENGASGGDSAEDKRAALRAKIEARAASRKEL